MPAAFFARVVALSIPLWILGALSQSNCATCFPSTCRSAHSRCCRTPRCARWAGRCRRRTCRSPMQRCLIVPFVISAFGEELGWQGYAFDPLAGRLEMRLAAVVSHCSGGRGTRSLSSKPDTMRIASSGKRLPRRACP